MKLLLFILVITILILQYRTINKKVTSYDILQSDNPDKDKFEDIINRKNITIFMNVVKDLEMIKNVKYSEFKDIDKDNKKKLERILNNHFKYYIIPLTYSFSFTLQVENKDFESPLILVDSYRYLHCQIDGNKKLIIFNQDQKKYLYFKKMNSQCNFWNIDLTKYPLTSKSKYVEILLGPGQMVYIPYGWIYCYKNLDNNIYVNCNSESIFSKLLKKKA